jgi:glucosamine--fructose-6-phosphate aminotransferase (isomerizing)
VPLQLFAYFTAVHHGVNVDHPRNLSKAVTSE